MAVWKFEKETISNENYHDPSLWQFI